VNPPETLQPSSSVPGKAGHNTDSMCYIPSLALVAPALSQFLIPPISSPLPAVKTNPSRNLETLTRVAGARRVSDHAPEPGHKTCGRNPELLPTPHPGNPSLRPLRETPSPLPTRCVAETRRVGHPTPPEPGLKPPGSTRSRQNEPEKATKDRQPPYGSEKIPNEPETLPTSLEQARQNEPSTKPGKLHQLCNPPEPNRP
jgi:hypothetical protein